MSPFPETHETWKCRLAAELLRSTGCLRMRALGSSMLPTLWPGDLLTVEATQFEHILAGDIVLYARDDRFFVHRAIAIDRQRCALVARGDALPSLDPTVGAVEVLGKVCQVERCGKALVVPRRLAFPARLAGLALYRWDSLCNVTLRLRDLVTARTPVRLKSQCPEQAS